ncbi:MAG TPA: serpin family protein [Candidatus Dormibacteraeota bacterium]|jgi:serine protease inhibitor|nr:serpin family protein [Candidatus Dormibacteraeota bacterium]
MNLSKITARIISTGALAGLMGISAPAVSAQDTEKLAAADNGFAFDLLQQIAKEQPDKNIFISPFSVSTALQMVGNGAAGETKMEMQRVLKTSGLQPDELNAAFKHLDQSLDSQTNVILDLADGIWYQKQFHLKHGFISDNKRYFQTELTGVDFENPKSADIINDWADKKTRGKIKGIVQFPFPPLTRVILANAIYFKGKWADPFDKSETKPRDFHLSGGDVRQVPMMWQSKTFSYQEGDGFQAVRLPYAGYRLQMYLFLPATNSGPQKLLADFNGENWRDNILTQFADREGTLALPKFKINYDVELNGPLESLGMKCAFDFHNADFSAMADDPLFVSEVKQKSFVAVDEEGTEAAAAVTTELMAGGIAPINPPKPFEMIVDRPFLFVIADEQTQSILFTGIIFDPSN